MFRSLPSVRYVGVTRMTDELWIVLGSVLTGIVGLLVWALQSRIEGFRRERLLLQEDRRHLYMEIIRPFVLAFSRTRSEQAESIMLSDEYLLAAREFTLIGSDDAVRALNDLMQHFFQHGEDESPDSKAVIALLGRLYLEIRKDLGGQKTKLQEIDMFRAQITDIDSIVGRSNH